MTGPSHGPAATRLHRISVEYRAWSLAPVSADLPRGCTALLGANGAGKTTLMRALLGMQRKSSGYFELEGYRSNTRRDRAEFRARIGYSPQKSEFPRFVSVRDALTFAADLKGVPRSDRSRAVVKAAATVNLDARLDVAASRLSGGEQRRLSLAQATVHAPQLVILDEPTAGLDPVQRLEFRTWLRRHCETGSALVSTHLIEDVAPIAHHVIVLADGRCRFNGAAAELSQGGSGEFEAALWSLLQGDQR